MSEPATDLRMRVAEFLSWDDGDPAVRYELVDGQPEAMAPARSFHRRIVVNAAVEIDRRLESGACSAEVEAGIHYTDEDFYIADLVVSCGPPENEIAIKDPVLIVEVLSPTTRTHDRGRKLDDYKTIASVIEVWLIDSEKRWIEVWRRDDEGWAGRDHVGKSSFESAVLGEAVALDRLYRNTTL